MGRTIPDTVALAGAVACGGVGCVAVCPLGLLDTGVDGRDPFIVQVIGTNHSGLVGDTGYLSIARIAFVERRGGCFPQLPARRFSVGFLRRGLPAHAGWAGAPP